MNYLIKNIRYLDIIQERVIEDSDIYIEEGIIKEIGDSTNFEIGRNCETIDGSHYLVTPGFINAHTHLGMSYFRNFADDMSLQKWLNEAIWPIEAHLTPDDIYAGSMLSMAEQILFGTTCYCDMYYEMDKVAEATKKIGMRGVLTRGLTSFDDREGKLKEVRDLYANYHNWANGRIKVVPAPHAIYTNDEEYLKEIFAMAEEEMDGIMHIHASETTVEVEECRELHEGRTPIDYLLDLGMDKLHTIAAHCVYMTDEEMDRVDKDMFFPIYNPSSNLKLASGFTPIQKMLQKGITVGIGTDGDSSNNNQNILEEIHIASIINKALNEDPEAVPAIEVLKMATINGAKALGLEEEIGSIEVGKKADLTFFDLRSPSFTPRNNLISALCYSASAEDVKHVMVDGNFLLRDRDFTTIDLEAVMKEVEERMIELVARKEAQNG